MLSEKYQVEQADVAARIEQARTAMETAAKGAEDAGKWVELIRQYSSPTKLTAELVNALIEKITVHEAVKSADGSREQEVEIYYRFVGRID